jgi:nitronate monooxygenase
MSWRTSRITQLLGLDLPIIQGPFGGGLSSVQLASCVSAAGGLGSFGAHHLTGDEIIDIARAIKSHTAKPFALNLWLPFDNSQVQPSQEEFNRYLLPLAPYFAELNLPLPKLPKTFIPDFTEQLQAVLAAAPAVLSFVFGVPSAWVVEQCRSRGIKIIGTATTVDEALVLEQGGVDAIVASGFEAGGHRVAFLRPAEESLIGTFSLIPQVVDAVKIPVIAAGGIADGRAIAAAFNLGAHAVQIGTAFLACNESGTSDLHRAQLFGPQARHTQLTCAFSGRLARGIHNRFMLEQSTSPAPYPIQNWLTSKLKQAATAQGRPDLMSLWCGQSAGLLKHNNAAQLMASLAEQADRLLS